MPARDPGSSHPFKLSRLVSPSPESPEMHAAEESRLLRLLQARKKKASLVQNVTVRLELGEQHDALGLPLEASWDFGSNGDPMEAATANDSQTARSGHLVLLRCCWHAGPRRPHDYAAEIAAWRTEREARLKADDGWLTLTGLFFLNEGDNSFGSSPQNDIVLRAGPERAGIITLRDGTVGVRAVERQTLLVDGRSVDAAQLWPSEGSDRPTITLGPLSLFCHESGDRLADASERFGEWDQTRIHEAPLVPGGRVIPNLRGRYVPHDRPYTMDVANTLGDILTLRTSGSVALTVKGEALRLTAIDYDGRLWFVFSDLTSGSETYPAARFLYADVPDLDGRTTVDFNQAYNPPCAFNPYTTCPLPPPENQLQVQH